MAQLDQDLLAALRARDPAGVEAAFAAGAPLVRDGMPQFMPLTVAIEAEFFAGLDRVLAEGAHVLDGRQAGLGPMAFPAVRLARAGSIEMQRRVADLVAACGMPLLRLLAVTTWTDLTDAEPAHLTAAIEGVDDIDARFDGRVTALGMAARFGNPRTIEVLLEAGADPTLDFGRHVDPVGYCAYNAEHWAAIFDRLRAAGLPPRRFQIEAAVHARNHALVDRLLAETPLVEGMAKALFLAVARRKRPDLAVRALEAGLDIDSDVMHAAISSWDPALLGALIDRGADVNQADARGLTPIMLAVTEGPALIGQLIEAGADVNAQTPPPHRHGRCALHAALRRRAWPVVKQLLEAGAGVPPDLREACVAMATQTGDAALMTLIEASPTLSPRPVDGGAPGAPLAPRRR